MTDPMPADALPADLLARVRRLMLIGGLTIALGIGAIFVVIGYKIFRTDGSAPPDQTALLPKGARVTATAATSDRLLVTVEIAGRTEIRSFDPRTLKPAGVLRFAQEP